jgi:hypothetical protein
MSKADGPKEMANLMEKVGDGEAMLFDTDLPENLVKGEKLLDFLKELTNSNPLEAVILCRWAMDGLAHQFGVMEPVRMEVKGA